MRAIVCKEFGPPENLVMEEVETPRPPIGEVLIDVKAVGVTFPDTLMLEDKYQFKVELPYIPGNEVAGVIAAVGSGVDGLTSATESWPHSASQAASPTRPWPRPRRPDRCRTPSDSASRPALAMPMARRTTASSIGAASRGREPPHLGCGWSPGHDGHRDRQAHGGQRHRRRLDRGEARSLPDPSAPTRPSTTQPKTSKDEPRNSPTARAATSSTTRSAATMPRPPSGPPPGVDASWSSVSPRAFRACPSI